MARMNKLLVCLVVLALAACSSNETPAPPEGAPTAAAPPPVAAPPSGDASTITIRDVARNGARPGNWRRAESDRNGVPIAWEFREDVDPARRATLPRLIVVSAVNYARTDKDQRPDASLLDVYDALERQLVTLLSDRADLVAVLTYYRQYDWYFYAASADDVAAIKALLAQAGQQDVTVSVENDPQGEFYATLVDRAGADRAGAGAR